MYWHGKMSFKYDSSKPENAGFKFHWQVQACINILLIVTPIPPWCVNYTLV